MMTPKRVSGLCALTAVMSMCMAGCGEVDSEDVFYLHVFNGYAGGGALTIYSSTGPIVQGLKFGEGTTEPIAIDRTRFGGELELSMEGVPQLATVTIDAFAFYPHETATLFLTRRSSESTFDLRVLRHNLLSNGGGTGATSSYTCALQLYNGMSVANTYTDNRYDVQTQWLFDNQAYVNQGIYEASTDALSIPTECGPLALNSLPPNVRSLILNGLPGAGVPGRSEQLAAIQQDPWLYLVDDPNTNYLTWRWGRWDGQSGDAVLGVRSQIEFLDCLSQAVSIEQERDAMGNPVSDNPCATAEDGTVSIPINSMTGFPQVVIDQATIQSCLLPTTYTGRSLKPNQEQGTIIFYRPLAGRATCQNTLRLRTRAVDSVFDPPQPNGAFVSFLADFPQYNWQHAIIYGRPIKPLVHQITSGDQEAGNAQDFANDVSYPNGQDAQGVRTQGGGGSMTGG